MKKNLSVKMTSGVARTVLAAMAAFTVMCGAIAIPSAALPALAAEEDTGSGETMWSEDYYRVYDNTGELSDAEREELDSLCIEFMKNYHADLAALSVTDELLDGQTLEEVAGYYFEDCDFGYGENRDGFLMIYNGDTDESLITAYGAAVDMIPADYLHYIEGSIPSFREQYGIFGPFYATVRHFNNYMEQNHAAKGDQTGAATEGQADNASEGQTAAVSSETETVTDPSARVGIFFCGQPVACVFCDGRNIRLRHARRQGYTHAYDYQSLGKRAECPAELSADLPRVARRDGRGLRDGDFDNPLRNWNVSRLAAQASASLRS